jgi:hypothetical protein
VKRGRREKPDVKEQDKKEPNKKAEYKDNNAAKAADVARK